MKRTVAPRTVALGAVWTASAGAAVGLGFLAVSLVDASASPGTVPAAASTTASPSTSPSTGAGGTSSAPTSPSGPATAEHATVAGTVFANCTGGQPVLAAAPAAGWWLDDSNDPGEIEFENATQKLEVHVVCTAAGPQFSVEGPRPDDNGGRGGDDDGIEVTPSPSSGSSSPASTPSAERTSGGDDDRDDSGGDDSGGDDSGHGSDDSDDDNSGHGSDDD